MEDKNLTLTIDDKNNFLETAKWGKFLGIVGFILSGLIIIVSLIFIGGVGLNPGELYPGIGSGIGFFYLIFSLIYIFPSLYVYRFAVHIQEGIRSDDQEKCSSAYNNLRKLFLFIGVMTIVVLALYVLVFLGIFLGGALGGML
ncbi:DUF5362 family protein [Ekhidna sp.]|uniref:DUF5362 family protein n=1 Tax=Ekhidna sp. TaxID=2608089 RepID=UPI003C7DE5B6